MHTTNETGTLRSPKCLLTALLMAVSAAGCGASPSDSAELSVYTTTGYLADAVANIAPNATVTTMVGPGGDPHTYQPSTQDIGKINSADIVFWNGLHLEAQMTDLLTSLGDKQLAVGDTLPPELLLDWPETDEHGNPLRDPHVWNSPLAWSQIVGTMAEKLGQIDPDNAQEYAENAATYQAQIDEVAAEAAALMENVGPESRTLITGHDAFNYFGDTYGLDVRATDFVSTEAALSAQEMSELAKLIADRQIPVIFQDNQANPQAITSLREAVNALGWSVQIADHELYADSLGAEPGVDTYLGVFRHNAQAISEALGGGQ